MPILSNLVATLTGSVAPDTGRDPRGGDRVGSGRATPTPRRAAVSRELDIDALYRRYGDLVYGRCRSLLQNEADAQEAAQEVFLRVWRYRDGFRGEASPTTWLFKVTTTTCLNRLRTRRRRPEDPVEEMPPGTAINDTVLHEIELRNLLDAVLGDEDERTVQCVVYHYADGMTHDEVGALLGVTGAAVRKRIAQFRTRLQGQLPSYEDER
ncbi:MAG: RNA polymerase sigma factor [Myxococcota bacterium]